MNCSLDAKSFSCPADEAGRGLAVLLLQNDGFLRPYVRSEVAEFHRSPLRSSCVVAHPLVLLPRQTHRVVPASSPPPRARGPDVSLPRG